MLVFFRGWSRESIEPSVLSSGRYHTLPGGNDVRWLESGVCEMNERGGGHRGRQYMGGGAGHRCLGRGGHPPIHPVFEECLPAF